jgi:hypothetical protein
LSVTVREHERLKSAALLGLDGARTSEAELQFLGTLDKINSPPASNAMQLHPVVSRCFAVAIGLVIASSMAAAPSKVVVTAS